MRENPLCLTLLNHTVKSIAFILHVNSTSGLSVSGLVEVSSHFKPIISTSHSPTQLLLVIISHTHSTIILTLSNGMKTSML